MFNGLSTLIFGIRNVNKAQNGDWGRAPVAAAQGAGILNEIAHYNARFAKGANAAIEAVETYAKAHKAAGYALKGAKWATNNVNTLIGVSSVFKVLRTEKGQRKEAAVREGAAITTMIAGERIAKAVLPKLLKGNSKLAWVARGLGFVAASIGSYAVGEYIGKDLGKSLTADSSFEVGVKNPFESGQNINCMA